MKIEIQDLNLDLSDCEQRANNGNGIILLPLKLTELRDMEIQKGSVARQERFEEWRTVMKVGSITTRQLMESTRNYHWPVVEFDSDEEALKFALGLPDGFVGKEYK